MFNPKPILPISLLLGWLGCQVVYTTSALPLPAVSASQQSTLAPGQTIEREITAGETHTYEITVEADKFVEFNCEHGELRGVLTGGVPMGTVGVSSGPGPTSYVVANVVVSVGP